MPPCNQRKDQKNFGAWTWLLLSTAGIAILLSTVYGAVNRDRLVVTYQYSSNVESEAQIYWDTGAGFNERQKRTAGIREGAMISQTIGIYEKGLVKNLRLDPLVSEGSLRISDVRVSESGCLLDLFAMCSTTLRPAEAATHQIAGDWKADRNTYQLLSQGSDPWLAWGIKFPVSQYQEMLVLNAFVSFVVIWAAIVAALLIASPANLNATTISLGVAKGMPGLAVFLAGCLLVWLSHAFADWHHLTFPLFGLSVALFGVLMAAGMRYNMSWRSGMGISVIVVLAMYIAPNVLFHIQGWARWPYGGRELAAYHWQLGRTPAENFRHSAVKYQREIGEIGTLWPAGVVFLSDVATSYYITSQLDAFMRNPLYHHREQDKDYTKDELTLLCSNGREGVDSMNIRQMLKEKNVEYVVLNRDTDNRNVRRSCLSRDYVNVIRNIKSFSQLVYTGRYLVVYAIS